MAPFDPTHRFETSWVLGPRVLCACRAVIGLYCLAARALEIAWPLCFPERFPRGRRTVVESFSYFTTLANWGVTAYFTVAAVHTLSYVRNPRHTLLSRFSPVLQHLHSVLYTTICVFPLLVTLMYWCILSTGSYSTAYDLWHDLSVHLLIAVFALFEIVVPRTSPPSFLHLVWLALLVIAYLFVAVLTFFCQGFWVYPYLDVERAGPLAVFGMLMTAFVILGALFVVVRFVIRARVYLTEEKYGLGLRYEADAAERSANQRDEGDIELARQEPPKGQVV